MKQFGVDGADEGARRMLGLVFSRDQSVRDAAVEAVDVLFLAGAESPVAAAEGLARVAAASALGELAALEEVLKLLVSDGRVPADGAVIKALWAQAGDRASHEASRAAALTVLSMCAARTPEIIGGTRLVTVAAALDGACQTRKTSNPALARAAAAVLARARPGGNAGTPESLGVCAPALPPTTRRSPRSRGFSRRRRRSPAGVGTRAPSRPSRRSTRSTQIPRASPRTS